MIRTLAAWQSVHRTPTALYVLFLCAGASLLLGDVRLAGFGPLRFVVPVSALLLIPVAAGLAVALACDNTARLSQPDPLRAKGARVAWLGVWIALAVVAANLGQLWATEVSLGAVARNVLLHVTLAVLLVSTDKAELAWIPTVSTTLVTMLFGAPEGQDNYFWWALLLRPRTTPGQWAVVLCSFMVVAGLYVWRGPGRVGNEASE